MDISYLLLLQNFREATNGIFNSFFSYITKYGEEFFSIMIVAAVYWCADKKQGIYTFLTWGLGQVVNGFLKLTACVYRPWIRDARIEPITGSKTTATGYSFPSGHTTNATAVYGSLAMNKQISKCLRALLILMVLLVGFSRNYLGVHTPQDVIVGCSVTVLILLFTNWILKKVDEKENLDIVVLIAGILFAVCVILYARFKSYPMDYDEAGNLIVNPAKMALDTYKGCGFFTGILISWFIDRRWLKYENQGTALSKTTRYVAGMLGYFVLLLVIEPLLAETTIPGAITGRFIRPVYIMLVVPLIIKKTTKS